ncbi:PAS domain S-box protein [Candidatus Magnetaquicoccus inordinatus]|uniref:PAS domain S-box protein n=1 Tax=Candidatus Magnetaquicoccus inordinatus TaxID=2496818 RepID=UPI00102B8E66|nr:PAS domain S-box protein [Candidatus Magnetaquicoccus inordinatus]
MSHPSLFRQSLLLFVVSTGILSLLAGALFYSANQLPLWQMLALLVLSAALLTTLLLRQVSRRHWQVQKQLQQQESSLRAMHQQLEHEQHFLKSIIQNIPELVWMKDAQGCYLICNHEFERFFGKPEEEILGKSDYDFMTRELADFFRAHDQLAAAAGKPTTNEEWITYADDGHRALLVTIKTPLYDQNGQLWGVLGIAHDITALRQQEDALRESQETLRIAQEVAQVGSWRLQLDSQQMFCSEESCRIFGFSECKQLQLQDFAACVPSEEHAMLAEEWQKALEGGAYDVEHRIIVRGRMRWVRARALLRQDSAGNQAMIGTVQDITERKELEDSLQKNLELVRAIIDGSPVAMALNDPQGNITYLNPAFEHTFGYNLAEISTLQEWWPRAYPDAEYRQEVAVQWQQHLEQAQRTQKAFVPVEVRIRCKGGEERTVIVSATPLHGSFAEIVLVSLFDISARKAAERALLESQQRYRALFESAPDAILVAEAATGLVVDANQKACVLLGRTLPELLTMHQSALHPPELRNELQREFARHALRRVEDFADPLQTAVLHANGTIIPVEISGCVVPVEGRALVLGIFRNVARYKQLEAAIADKDAQYRLMLETLPDGYWSVDGQTGTITDVNTAYLQRSGYTRAELLGKHISELDATESLAEVHAHIENILHSGGDNFETWHRSKDGKRWPVEITTTVSSTLGGRIASFARDISQRKQEEERIRRDNLVHQQLAKLGKELLEARNSRLPLLCRKVLECCKEVTGSPYGYVNVRDPYHGGWQNVVLDRQWLPFPEDDDREGLPLPAEIAPWGEALRQRRAFLCNQPQRFDHFYGIALPSFQCQRQLVVPVWRGEQVIAELAVVESASDYTAEQEVIMAGVADIFAIALERFALERQLQQAIKMEAIGTLSAGIAHDFNNILGIIMGFAELAQRKSKEHKRVKESLEEILLASTRAKSLVDQLLTFSRKKSGEHGRVLLSAIVKEVESFLRHTIPPTILLEVAIGEGGFPVQGDAGQLHQLLLNLCSNARQAMRGEHGRIAVRVQRAVLNWEEAHALALPEGEYACLQVQDSGVGMSKEVVEHIFEPFFTTKEIGKGTGLGLSVVHGIVTGHHGAIHVQSTPGQGSLFAVYLPMLQEDKALQQPFAGKSGAQHAGSGRILVVDDEVQIVTIYEQLLTIAGYEVVAVSDALEALHLVVAQPDRFTAIITDQAMPGMSGVELAARIKALAATLPILLCTGLGETSLADSEQLRCVDAVLHKPVPLSVLRAALDKLLQRSS